MEERWETRIHTLDVGQGDSSIIQVAKLEKIKTGPDDYLKSYLKKGLSGDKAGSARMLPVIHFYRAEGEEIIDTVWEYNILIDGGEEGQEEKILESINQNIKFCLDAVIITHADSDHYGGIYAMLVKNNFWHLCKVIYFTVGREIIRFLKKKAKSYESYESNEPDELDDPKNWPDWAKEVIKVVIGEIFDDFLIFASDDRKDLYNDKFIDAMCHIIEKIKKMSKKDGFIEFMRYMEYYFKYVQENEEEDEEEDEKEEANEDVVKFLYQEMMEDVEIRSAVGTGLEKEGYEIHTRLPSNLVIYMSELAHAKLFSGAKFKEAIYTGERIAQGIEINKNNSLFKMYGVKRKIRILTPKILAWIFWDRYRIS